MFLLFYYYSVVRDLKHHVRVCLSGIFFPVVVVSIKILLFLPKQEQAKNKE